MALPQSPPGIAPRVPPPGVLVRLCEVAGAAEDEFNHWYQQHHLAKQLAVYSTGRGVSLADRDEIATVVAATNKNGGGIRTLMYDLVQSRLFRTR